MVVVLVDSWRGMEGTTVVKKILARAEQLNMTGEAVGGGGG